MTCLKKGIGTGGDSDYMAVLHKGTDTLGVVDAAGAPQDSTEAWW